jgi:hypothetical protein
MKANLIVRAELTGDDTASALGITVKSGSPILALCRKLVEAGHDPNTPLEAFRNGTLALRVKSIGLGAHLKMGSTGSGTPIFAYAGNGDIAPPIRFPRETA